MNESKENKINIPKDIFKSEIIAGDLNDLESGLIWGNKNQNKKDRII